MMNIDRNCFKYLIFLNLFYLAVLVVVHTNVIISLGKISIVTYTFAFMIGMILLLCFICGFLYSSSSYTKKSDRREIKRRYSRSNKIMNLNNYLIISIILLVAVVLVSDYVKELTIISDFFEIPIFLIATILIAKGTWRVINRIDRIDLDSDLNCWGLRILGTALFLIGLWIVIFVPMALLIPYYEVGNATPPYLYIAIPAVLGLGIFVIGIFSDFRSFRRYGYFVYMR